MAVLVAAVLMIATMVPAWAADTSVTITYYDKLGTSSNNSQPGTSGTELPGNAAARTATGTISEGQPFGSYTVDSGYVGNLDGYTFVGWSTEDPVTAGTLKPTTKKLRLTGNTYSLYAVYKTAGSTQYSITIDNAYPNEKYSVYKIFDVTYAEQNGSAGSVPAAPAPDGTHKNLAYAYTIKDTNTAVWDIVTQSHNKTDPTFNIDDYGLTFTKNTNANEWNVILKDDSADKAKALAVALNSGKNTLTAVTGLSEYVAPGEEFTVYPGDKGYYFVDTTTGSFCSLDTTEPAATVREKNTIPTMEKTVKSDTGSWVETPVTKNIGDTVEYKITITDGKGTDALMTVHDTLDAGLTLDVSSIRVTPKANGVTLSPVTHYNIKYSKTATNIDFGTMTDEEKTAAKALTDGCTFEVQFTTAGTALIPDETNVEITYSATLNKNAVIGDAGNGNTAKLKYSNQDYAEKKVTVKTYAAAIFKFNEAGTDLANAEFTLAATDGRTNATAMYFDRISEGSADAPAVYQYHSTYTATTEGVSHLTNKIVTPGSGVVLIYGLKDGSYTVTESGAPDGYYPLTTTPTLRVWPTTGNLTANQEYKTGKWTAETPVVATFEYGTDDKYDGTNIYELYDANDTDDGTEGTQPGVNILPVENKTGSELPSTGGMGTTVLYIVGGMLVILAGAYLFFSRKRTA